MSRLIAAGPILAPLILLAMIPTACGASDDQEPADWPPWDYSETVEEEVALPVLSAVSPARMSFTGLMSIYRRFISPVSGKHCPMYPSCSAYGRDAVARKGVFAGVLMAFDRLHRCGHDLRFYEVVFSDGIQLRYDPVEYYSTDDR